MLNKQIPQFFTLILVFGYPLATYKNKIPCKSDDYRAFLVLEAGLEPAQPQWPRDFKSLVSTDSTIRATYGATRDPNLGKVVLYQLSYFRIMFLTGAKIILFF